MTDSERYLVQSLVNDNFNHKLIATGGIIRDLMLYYVKERHWYMKNCFKLLESYFGIKIHAF